MHNFISPCYDFTLSSLFVIWPHAHLMIVAHYHNRSRFVRDTSQLAIHNGRMSDPAWCRVTAEERARLRQAEVAHAMESMLLEAAALANVAATERERRELLVRNVLVDRYPYLYFYFFCSIAFLDDFHCHFSFVAYDGNYGHAVKGTVENKKN